MTVDKKYPYFTDSGGNLYIKQCGGEICYG